MEDKQETLHWHALNYRTAAPQHAHEMWLALEAFVVRRIAQAVFADRERIKNEVMDCALMAEDCEGDPPAVDLARKAFAWDIMAAVAGRKTRVTPNDRTQSIDQD